MNEIFPTRLWDKPLQADCMKWSESHDFAIVLASSCYIFSPCYDSLLNKFRIRYMKYLNKAEASKGLPGRFSDLELAEYRLNVMTLNIDRLDDQAEAESHRIDIRLATDDQ
jgi:hypothetical protein